ncbi:hypothetical protein PR048_012964 [Dryococelus australis]|uniref:DDE-1 domain-containing protein n=1 Tax=Dryococelus australis TaxID=614101 RepID=A0ABQ9HQW4_9NEOP|nr:hypothetical protein PR048_012964 [Dryococelus australis]
MCYRNYTELKFDEALEAVAYKMSLHQASREFSIPYGTLHNKFNGKHGGKPRRSIAFSEIEELAIINGFLTCSDWGFLLSVRDVQIFTKMHLDLKGCIAPRFKNNVPGKDWALSLLKRHKRMVDQRIASNLKTSKAEVFQEILKEYFENLQETLKKIPPNNIYNYCESNVSDDPGKMKGIYRRGVKYPVKICNHTKSTTTVLTCGSASRILSPPYIIYNSEGMYDTWKEGGLKGEPCCTDPRCSRGFRYNRTKHRWIYSATFHNWFISTFLPHAKWLEEKVILIGDNLSSHFNENVLQLCTAYNINFVCLPPNATHLCQPLYMAFFRAFKAAWRHELTAWKEKHPREGSLLTSAIRKINSVAPRNPTTVGGDVELPALVLVFEKK